MDKILTISIAAYNAENDIERCLESLINSGVIDKLDVIVVNDGSKDNTVNIVNSYVSQFKDSIRIIDKENGGHGSTINESIKLAVGKYYKILDSDDWVESANLSRLIYYLEKNDVDMVLNPYHEVSFNNYNNRKLIAYNINNLDYKKIYDISLLNENTVLYMHSLTFKSDIIKKMGSVIDEHCFYVDMEYCIFPMVYAKSFAYLDFPIYQYLLGSQTQSMNMQNMIKRRDQHLKVLTRLIKFYNENEQKMVPNIKNIIQLRIRYAIFQQYRIYFSMTDSVAIAKNEIMEFDRWLKNENRDLYSGVQGRFMKIINMNRNTSFIFFSLSTKLLANKL